MSLTVNFLKVVMSREELFNRYELVFVIFLTEIILMDLKTQANQCLHMSRQISIWEKLYNWCLMLESLGPWSVPYKFNRLSAPRLSEIVASLPVGPTLPVVTAEKWWCHTIQHTHWLWCFLCPFEPYARHSYHSTIAGHIFAVKIWGILACCTIFVTYIFVSRAEFLITFHTETISCCWVLTLITSLTVARLLSICAFVGHRKPDDAFYFVRFTGKTIQYDLWFICGQRSRQPFMEIYVITFYVTQF